MNKKDIVTAEVSVIVLFLYYLYHLYILVSDILSPPSGRFGLDTLILLPSRQGLL